jgi:acetyl-CoA carboxylase biotin carboxyl carrier protein
MDIAELEQLVEMVRESNIGELTLRHVGERVTIRKAGKSAAPSLTLAHHEDDYDYPTDYVDIADEESEDAGAEHDKSVLVTAPLVGVFGHVKPIVGLNARVTEGQVIGVIEAMKIITEIEAPAAGTVVDLFIEDGHPVEFGQALFEIRTE